MISRRGALTLGLGGLSLTCGCATTGRGSSGRVEGCFATAINSYYSSSDLRYLPSSGWGALDQVMSDQQRRLRTNFGVRPAFSYFTEPAHLGPNALATSERLLSAGSDGTVLFGTRFIQQVREQVDSDAGAFNHLSTVLAHEYAHIFQLGLNGVYSMPVPWRELQADFLASWHMAKTIPHMGEDDWRYSLGPAGILHRLGDLDYFNPQHHGTNPQRLVMSSEGWTFARERPNATALEAANLGASILELRGQRVRIRPTRVWFEGGDLSPIG